MNTNQNPLGSEIKAMFAELGSTDTTLSHVPSREDDDDDEPVIYNSSRLTFQRDDNDLYGKFAFN